ncbi:MAG TPA: hypothetical protein VIU12_34495 [Chryseolinea sp.]
MELNELFGKKLTQMNKRHKRVELLFEDARSAYLVKFEGFVFESELSPMDQTVAKISRRDSLGMKGIDLLSYFNYNDTSRFEQIFIQFDENAFKKNELICIARNVQLIKTFDVARFENRIQIFGVEALLEGCLNMNFPSELSELSTHTRLEEVSDIDINWLTIDQCVIHTVGNGLVRVELQYGSDGDQLRDDGEKFYENYPFGFDISLKYNETGDLEIESIGRLIVDTSSFYNDNSWGHE